MRILMVIRRMDLGGSESHVCDLANELIKFGHEVWIYAQKGRRDRSLDPKLHRVYPLLQSSFLPLFILGLYMTAKTRKIQLIHAHQHTPILGACHVGQWLGLPVVATLHGRYTDQLKERFVRSYLGKVFVVSSYWLQRIREDDPRLAKQCIYLPNWVPHWNSTPPRSPWNSPFRILYASRLNKSHVETIRFLIGNLIPSVAKKHPDIDIRFSIAGDGPGLRDIHRLSAKINYETGREVVEFYGYQDSILSLMEQSSLVFGVGRVALEALALGVPVIPVTSSLMNPPITLETVNECAYHNFLPRGGVPLESERLTATISNVIQNFPGFKLESERIATYIKDCFSADRIIGEILLAYEEVLKSSMDQKSLERAKT